MLYVCASVCVCACRQRADYNDKEVEVGSHVAAFYPAQPGSEKN